MPAYPPVELGLKTERDSVSKSRVHIRLYLSVDGEEIKKINVIFALY
jgi:hypothetical protein